MNKREINDIFSSKKDMLEGKLEDFKKIKLIGKGNFGKVIEIN